MPYDGHRINLLPNAVKVKRDGQKKAGLVIAGAAAIIVLLGFLWFQKGQAVSNANGQVAAQKSKNAQLQQEVKKLDYIEAKAKAVSDREVLVKDAWSGEVSWYQVLNDVAATMPSQTWLTSFQANSKTQAAAAGAKPTAAGGPVTVAGTFTVNGKGFDHPDAADWLARISQMKEVANLWLSNSTVSGGDNGGQQLDDFSSSGSLTSDAWSSRAKKSASGNLYEGTNAQ
jgi:Tfp pilus assembly protein PilN